MMVENAKWFNVTPRPVKPTICLSLEFGLTQFLVKNYCDAYLR
jgi:hypothetical protein